MTAALAFSYLAASLLLFLWAAVRSIVEHSRARAVLALTAYACGMASMVAAGLLRDGGGDGLLYAVEITVLFLGVQAVAAFGGKIRHKDQ